MQENNYNLIIVEDEPIILENIKTKISKINAKFRIVGETFNGQTALEIIHETHPDIILTDIRMPIMDGLQLIKEVRKNYPELPVIIISGYDEFAYARQAIKYGVEDYLLKPVKIDSLQEVMHKICSKIDRKRTNSMKEALVSSIRFPNSITPLPKHLNNSRFNLYLICLGNIYGQHPCNSTIKRTRQFQNVWNKINWNKMMTEILSNSQQYCLFNENAVNQKFLITIDQSDITNNQNNIETAQLILDKLKPWIKPWQVTISTNSNSVLFEDINKTAYQIRTLLEQGLIIGKSKIVSLGISEKINIPFLININTERKFAKLIQTDNRNGLQDELYRLMQKWQQNGQPQKWVEKALLQLIRIFLRESNYLLESKIFQLEHELIEIISSAQNLTDIQPDIWTLFNNLLLSDNTSTTTSDIVKHIQAYLMMNFSKTINLQDIAEKFNFSQSYLSKIYKSYTGQTPIEYLITLRIEEAKNLIENRPDLHLKEIGEIIGYPDPHYFSRIFKNITGISPSSYREKYK